MKRSEEEKAEIKMLHQALQNETMQRKAHKAINRYNKARVKESDWYLQSRENYLQLALSGDKRLGMAWRYYRLAWKVWIQPGEPDPDDPGAIVPIEEVPEPPWDPPSTLEGPGSRSLKGLNIIKK